ncbi:hypothetical protein FOMPIDRAFT_62504 [Fomitopsis schrenkii]|uniref:Cytochrome P450 n=1 Tax=Fomitopsis schrenkii TaxID=2126942 RepID=S8EXS7_FOMSC|nr:hypothetical protein FOMPIDRAFT_62504 [Fomitopsis schrenkii]
MYASLSNTQVLALCIGSFALWRFLRACFKPSPLDNIRGPPPESFAAGNYGQLYHRQGWDFHKRIAAEYGSVVKLHAAFGRPCLYIYDPAALNYLLLSDVSIVEQSSWIGATYRLLLGPGLMSQRGDQHRRQRKTLNPVFSPRNLKDMLPVFYSVIYKARTATTDTLQSGPTEIDMLQWTSRGALEVMGQAGLGYSFDSFEDDSTNEFARALKDLFPSMQRIGFVRTLSPMFLKLGPQNFRRRLAVLVSRPWGSARELLAIVDKLDEKSQEILDTRKELLRGGDGALRSLEGKGRDLMTCILKANAQAAEEDKLNEEEILGQVASFVLAGSDTSSITLVQIIQYLAQHHDVQEKLRCEVREARKAHGGDLPYEELMKRPWVDAVVKETLRVCVPLLYVVARQLCKDVVAPLSSPVVGRNGRVLSEVFIPKGTPIFLGVLASNVNPAVWGADAAEWKPERWLTPPPKTLVDARIPGVYSSLMTFAGGNRTCIGLKFAEMELKAMLFVLLDAFSFAVSDKEIVWNIATVRYPTIGKDGMKPQLPLIVMPLNSARKA